MYDMIDNSKKIKNYDLFVLYKNTNNIEVRNEIFDIYRYMPEIISRKYANKGIERDDLFQVASMGLLYAIERFDVTKGFEFTSFATPTILGEIKKHFRDKGWAVKVPRKIQEVIKKINEYNSTMSNELNKIPSVKDIAEYINHTEEEVLEAIEAGKVYNLQSLDTKYDSNDENNTSLIDLIGIEEKDYIQIENNDFINKSINKLNELEKKIIIKRFYYNLTQSDIAEELNISQMTVSRIEKRSLEKLKIELNK